MVLVELGEGFSNTGDGFTSVVGQENESYSSEPIEKYENEELEESH